MKLFVTGAAGMLGRRVAAVARDLGHHAVGSDIDDLDLTDADTVRARLRAEAPSAVVNCAAYTDVDGAESHEDLATLVNGAAAANVAGACQEVGAFIVHVSTDYVFSGDATRPYVESDEPAPRTAYGRSKLAGERAIARSGAGFAIARTAWLYGAGGKNFVDTMLALAETRDEVSVVADQRGCPTWTGHLAPALVEIAERRAEGIHHLAAGGDCSWYELTVEVFHQAGVACRVLPTTTDRFPRPAPRPAYSVLGTERADPVFLPRWQEGVAAHLSERVPA
ncbi:MAG TPA: dTDP-4-dehydrorhamnose reductase [Solirubrobacteraceae bacterium]|jgi:dTDP-4-dehydrorhamnose reductase